MERKVGEIFDYYGRKLIVELGEAGCDGCFFNHPWRSCTKKHYDIVGCCTGPLRTDYNYVIFKRYGKKNRRGI